jgi:hypothetical protein
MLWQIPKKLEFLLRSKARDKGAYGGRGGGKSWGFADSLLILAMAGTIRVLCARELQNSIKDSVHRLLRDRIERYEIGNFFQVTDNEIRGQNGSLFIFKGLRTNVSEIKSLEGIDYCWVEEAEKVSQESIEVLSPTIRKEGSEIWWSWNTGTKADPVYKRLVATPVPNSSCVKMNYYDNPWFPDVLRKEMEHDKKFDYEKYKRVWLGEPGEGGPFFTNFDRTGMIAIPEVIPAHICERTLYGGFDFGWGVNGWASFGMWQLSDGLPTRLMHWYRNHMTAEEQADDLYEYIESFHFTHGVFPIKVWYDNQMDNRSHLTVGDWSPIDYFTKSGKWKKQRTQWIPANKARVNGWQIVSDYLGRDISTQLPKMQYWPEFNKQWADCMENMQQDENNPLDLMKCDTDHPADETRYCLVGLKALQNLNKTDSKQKGAKMLQNVNKLVSAMVDSPTGY